jgi:tRNA(Arg) A34 adenosine deaminase TadA
MKKFPVILLVLFVGFFFLYPNIHRFKPRHEVEVLNSHWLRQIAANSLKSDDVPIGAILYYDDEVIGEGNQTVLKDGDPTAHAVINALRDAAQNLGYDEFSKLDREKLLVITTYDPCVMCKGALMNNDIHNVEFFMSKKVSKIYDEQINEIKYEFTKYTSGREYIQDSLFVIHPKYPFIP